MPAPSLESALVRILRAEGELLRPVGAGFLVSPQHIITCAHVVNCAFSLPKNAADQSEAEILLDFPLLTNRPLLRAKILHWFPVQEANAVGDIEDIAVLELLPEIPLPDEARPAPVVLPHEQSFFDRKVRMCGFPAGAGNGTYSNGVLQGPNAKGWVEIHHQGSEQIEAGFSGTAVWSAEENAAMGMTVSILNRQNARVAYMIPAALLIKAFPDLNKHSRPVNPYRGLESFREQDARFYFGRESDTTALRKKVEQQPFTAVIGASGSGKSSLVLAGVIPTLRRTGDWLIADCRPKKQPFYELSSCLVPLLYDDELEVIKRTRQCAADFYAGELSLSDLICRIVQKKGVHRFLLVVDQFEELYTLNEATEARCFIDLLLEAEETNILSVVITMRADFLETALHYGVFAEALNNASIIVPPISEDGLREAVAKPAELFTVAFESGLIDLIIRDVGREPGNLPLLEFCLTQLWERQEFRRITHDAYTAIGGVQQALANHADAVYTEFTEQERKQLRHILLKLVRPGQGTEDTRQVATVGQIAEEYRGLITRLADKRLIVTGRDEERGEETVEVVHEALIRRWQTLRQWVDEEREFLVWQEKLRVLLVQWEESGKDEGALLRGLPLEEALRWRETHVAHLTEGKREFIAASETLREKTRKVKERQRRRNITSLAVGLVIAVMLSLFSAVQWRNAEKERQHADQKTIEVKKEKDKAEQQTLAANYNLAKVFEKEALRSLERANKEGTEAYKRTLLFTSAALEQKIANDTFRLEENSITKLFAPEVFYNALLGELWRSPSPQMHEARVNSVAFSPDNKTLASASDDKTIRLWDTQTGKALYTFKSHTAEVNCVAFSPNGKTLASASNDKTVRLWNRQTGKVLNVFKGHEEGVRCVAFSPDGRTLASASMNNTVKLWDIQTRKVLHIFKGHIGNNPVFSVAFSPNGKTLASASTDSTIRLWDRQTGKVLHTFKGHEIAVSSTAFSPDGKTLASASWDRTVRLWDIQTGKVLHVFKGHEAWINSVAFSPNGKTLASASDDQTVKLWDRQTGKVLHVFKGHVSVVFNATFSPDGSTLASASDDKTVRLWDIGKKLYVFKSHEDAVFSAVFSPDGRTLASASRDNTVRLWDRQTGKVLHVFKGHEKSINYAAFSPDGRTLASASADNSVKLWDIQTGKELHIFKGHENAGFRNAVFSVAFSPDDRTLASASMDNTVRIWDRQTGKELYVFKGHEEGVNSVSFSPDGRTLASASDDKTVRLWNIQTGNVLKVFKGHEEGVNSVSFSPDGRTLASASDDKTVRLWNIQTGNVLKVFKGHEAEVYSATFSPDGKTLVSASNDKTVRLWDIQTGNELKVFKGHTAPVFSVAFSPDGKTLASASNDKTVRLWDRDISPYHLFLHNSKPTPLYHTFIEAVKFLWQLDVQGFEIIETERRTPADLKKYGTLLAPPPPNQSKFDQVLEWAEKQQER